MDKVTFVTTENPDGVTVEHAIIDRGNEQFTSMTKAEYERRQAEQSNDSTPL